LSTRSSKLIRLAERPASWSWNRSPKTGKSWDFNTCWYWATVEAFQSARDSSIHCVANDTKSGHAAHPAAAPHGRGPPASRAGCARPPWDDVPALLVLNSTSHQEAHSAFSK
jgi:hypothetical protein